MKDRVRQITRRTGGRSMRQVFAELRGYLLGWKEYFRLADTPRIFRDLDEWIRHRLRAVHLKQWKRGTTVYRELRARGLSERRRPPDGGRQRPPLVEELGAWLLNIASAHSLLRPSWGYRGLPRDLNLPNRRMRTRM